MAPYSEEDIKRFKEYSGMIFLTDEQLVVEMKCCRWRASAAAEPIIQRGALLEQPIVQQGDLIIDRSELFSPVGFSPDLKGFTIDEPEDNRSLALARVDPAQIRLEAMLQKGETQIMGEERLRRLKTSGFIRLDAKIFEAFWNNQHLIPGHWNELKRVDFPGTILLHPKGYRHVLCLYLDGEWRWYLNWLAYDRGASKPSAVLAN